MKTLKQEAQDLAENKLLTVILRNQTNDTIAAWRQSDSPAQREQHWHALRQLDKLAGAIDDAIREHGGSRASD